MVSSELPQDFVLPVPVRVIRFPVEIKLPHEFDSERLETWPRLEGRLEYVKGKLLYMPPCAADQAETVADIVAVLVGWQRSNPGFAVRTNEAGMILGKATRAADAAIWRRADLDPDDRGVARAAPVLVVEVVGRYDNEEYLASKVQWYLDAGVEVIWLVYPKERDTHVVTTEGDQAYGAGSTIPPHPSLPGLTPAVDQFFVQLDR